MTLETKNTSVENTAETTKPDVIKEALSERLMAFFAMNNTRIYNNRRFGFLMAGGAAVLLAGFALPKDRAESTTLVTKVDAPQIDLTR